MQEDFKTRYKYPNSPHAPQRRPASEPQHQPPENIHAPAPKQRGKLPRHGRKLLVLFVLLILVAAGSGFYYIIHKAPKPKHYFPSYITKKDVSIAVYYPVNLPQGFKVDNDFKVIKHNILYYSVSNRAGDKFYITIQPIAPQFDYATFQKKFPNPDQYNTAIGTNLVGVTGSSLIGSIQTNQNVWILLNSSAVGSVSNMETITRSLQQVSL